MPDEVVHQQQVVGRTLTTCRFSGLRLTFTSRIRLGKVVSMTESTSPEVRSAQGSAVNTEGNLASACWKLLSGWSW